MSDIRLISLETGGNQAYIFATNKLRNVVGASELLYRVGTSYVERAVEAATGRAFKVADIAKEPKIDDMEGKAIEVVIATSGKALLLARGEETAKCFIREWSRIVADEAPGVDALAVYSDVPVAPGDDLDAFKRAFDRASQLMSRSRASQGMPVGRFPRLPIVAECAFSGLPAVDISKEHGREVLVSASSLAQRNALDDLMMERIKGLFPGDGASQFRKGLATLEQRDLDWLAVIHADGNGLGQLFIGFDQWVKALVEKEERAATGRDYIAHYRAFSSALDRISRDAFQSTVTAMWHLDEPDIVPIVVGGDDLTVVMDGKRSFEFAQRFMVEFCERTASDPATQPILRCAGLDRLGMCAGISIAKPHFPFSQSYRLAEGLMSNAKQVKDQYGKGSIALDFHILYDSVSTSISDIRKRLEIKEGGRTRILTAKPYVVQQGATWNRDKGIGPNEEWNKVHDYDQFDRAREAITKLPSSQAHAVRDALFSELTDTQESEWIFLRDTYSRGKDNFRDAWEKVYQGEDRGHLYVKVEPERDYTYFLDALEALKFQEGKRSEGKGGDRT